MAMESATPLGERHIKAMVALWQQEQLAPATIQTYLSFLRGLSQWIGKPGLVRQPQHYGLQPEEYQRHEAASRDKSWSGQHIDIEGVIDQICRFDRHVGAAMLLVQTHDPLTQKICQLGYGWYTNCG